MFETEIGYGATEGAASVGLGEMVSRRIAPTTDWTDMGAADHFVQFYEEDDYIVDAVAEYLIHGIKSGETCIVAATRQHLEAIERVIGTFASGLETARADGRYIALDAEDTLSKFMVDAMPDAERFSAVIGELVEAAAKRGGRIRVFGEMVGVLCAEGNYAGAVRLEGLWNGLRKAHAFSLYCAYPMAGLKHAAAGENMAHICDGHTRVIPNESYTSLTSVNERLRKIAILQQKGMQLEAEIAELEKRIADKQAVRIAA